MKLIVQLLFNLMRGFQKLVFNLRCFSREKMTMRERDRYRITSVCAHAFTRRERERVSLKGVKKRKSKRVKRERKKREIFEKSEREMGKEEDTFRAQSLKRNETRFFF